MTRYQLDPVFDRTPDGAIKGIIRYDIYLDGHFPVTNTSTSSCPQFLNQAALWRLSTSSLAALYVVKVKNAPRNRRPFAA
jgi:hypothetical protein